MKRKIPATLDIGDVTYRIEFVKSFKDDPNMLGYCDPMTYKIQIKAGLSKRQTVAILVHEIFHALEAEHGVHVKHKLIERLERPLASLLMKNGLL